MKRVVTFFLLSIASVQAQSDVDIKEGALRTSQIDLKIQIGKSETWMLKRSYSSRSNAIGFFGLGWCSDLDRKLIVVDVDHVIFKHCDQVVHYRNSPRFPAAVPPAALVADGDSVSRVARFADGSLRRTAGFLSESYNSKGYLVALQQFPGREVRIRRTQEGLPFELTLPSGLSVSFRFLQGRVQSAIGPLGATVSYNYLGSLLQQVNLPAGEIVRLQYDDNQNLSMIVSPNQQKTEIAYDKKLDVVVSHRTSRERLTHFKFKNSNYLNEGAVNEP